MCTGQLFGLLHSPAGLHSCCHSLPERLPPALSMLLLCRVAPSAGGASDSESSRSPGRQGGHIGWACISTGKKHQQRDAALTRPLCPAIARVSFTHTDECLMHKGCQCNAGGCTTSESSHTRSTAGWHIRSDCHTPGDKAALLQGSSPYQTKC